MTRSPALVRVDLGSKRWVLPWIAFLFVSATIAYAMNDAFAGGTLANARQPKVQVAVSADEVSGTAALEAATSSPSAASAGSGRAVAPERCAVSSGGSAYAGVDWWIVAESQRMACEPVRP